MSSILVKSNSQKWEGKGTDTAWGLGTELKSGRIIFLLYDNIVKQNVSVEFEEVQNGTPVGSRTPNLLIRSQTIYFISILFSDS